MFGLQGSDSRTGPQSNGQSEADWESIVESFTLLSVIPEASESGLQSSKKTCDSPSINDAQRQ